ncbi:MAG: methionine ABC transporter permease [Clostridium fessum]
MIQQYLGISPDKLIKAGWETLYMVGFSLIIGSIVGFLIAIVLWLTRKGGLKENSLLYTILNGFINIIRSTPFIILLVCVMPFTKIIVGTRIGTRAAIVPLVIYTAPFLARLLETSLLEVGGGIIEAAQSIGSDRSRLSFILHFRKHLLRLSSSDNRRTISLIGATAMAGYIGGGGIGNIALTYGYQTFNFPLMFATVFILIALCLEHPESGKPAVTEETDPSVTYNLFLLKKLLI